MLQLIYVVMGDQKTAVVLAPLLTTKARIAQPVGLMTEVL